MPQNSLPSASANRVNESGDEALRLESRPSPVLPTVLLGSLSALFFVVVYFATTVKIDQIVSVPGKLVTRRSTQDLTTPEPGVVKRVLVKSGDVVQQGQELVVLDPRVQTSNVDELQKQLEAEAARLQSEQARIRETIRGLETQLEIDRQILEPFKQLAEQGASSQLQLIEKQRQLEVTRRSLAEAREQLQTISFQSQSVQAQLRASLVKSQNALDLVTLRAPVAGTVIDLEAQTGLVVNNTTSLLKLVPIDDLVAQTFARDSDIAFLRAGQDAEISFTTYDKTIYGTLPGSVTLVSQDSLPPEPPYDYPHFPVTLALSAQNLSKNGKTFELQPGMALNAEIKLQKRTIFQLIFSRMSKTTDAVRTMRGEPIQTKFRMVGETSCQLYGIR